MTRKQLEKVCQIIDAECNVLDAETNIILHGDPGSPKPQDILQMRA